jgi:hypothetical protein
LDIQHQVFSGIPGGATRTIGYRIKFWTVLIQLFTGGFKPLLAFFGFCGKELKAKMEFVRHETYFLLIINSVFLVFG